MAQNFPNRILADKYKVGGEFHDRLKPNLVEKPITENDMNPNKSTRKRFGFIMIVSMSIFIFFLLAVIKNPSKTDSYVQVRSYLVEEINDKVSYQIKSDETGSSSFFNCFERFLIKNLAPNLIDSMFEIRTSDYILFSTFDVKMENNGENVSVVSGVIVFGKILPLSTDIEK